MNSTGCEEPIVYFRPQSWFKPTLRIYKSWCCSNGIEFNGGIHQPNIIWLRHNSSCYNNVTITKWWNVDCQTTRPNQNVVVEPQHIVYFPFFPYAYKTGCKEPTINTFWRRHSSCYNNFTITKLWNVRVIMLDVVPSDRTNSRTSVRNRQQRAN